VNEQIRDELTKILRTYHPDKQVRFADALEIEDIAGLQAALRKTNKSMCGKLGRFWRWYYRPRRV